MSTALQTWSKRHDIPYSTCVDLYHLMKRRNYLKLMELEKQERETIRRIEELLVPFGFTYDPNMRSWGYSIKTKEGYYCNFPDSKE
jgi:hypothetical protein